MTEGIRRHSFAVVIPTYNRAQRLLGTLETVFHQDAPPAEIIVVDNCSSDETTVVVEALAATHPELRYIRHETNLERAASRNTGMSSATADYVTFLDSDDRMYPQNLREAGDFAAETGAKFFHNLYHSVHEDGTHFRNWPAPSLRNQLRAIALGNFLSCIGVFIHRDIYSAYRFDTNPVITGSEDYEFWLRVAADHPLERISRINSAIVQHTGRTMMSQDTRVVEERIEYLLEKIGSDPHLGRVYAPYRKRMRAGRMVFLAMIANDNCEPEAAFAYLRRALTAHPWIAVHYSFIRSLQIAIGNALRSAVKA